MTVSPAHLLQLFPAGCYVSLISHAPDFQDLDLFNNWVYFAELKVVFRFELQFKMPLIARLQQPPQRAILIPSEHATCLTFGDLRLDIGILVQALQDIGCQSVRVSAAAHSASEGGRRRPNIRTRLSAAPLASLPSPFPPEGT